MESVKYRRCFLWAGIIASMFLVVGCEEPVRSLPGRGGANSCPFANDGECDEPILCRVDTDTSDCAGPTVPEEPAEPTVPEEPAEPTVPEEPAGADTVSRPAILSSTQWQQARVPDDLRVSRHPHRRVVHGPFWVIGPVTKNIEENYAPAADVGVTGNPIETYLPRLLYSRDGMNWEISDSVHCDDVHTVDVGRGIVQVRPAFKPPRNHLIPTASSESVWVQVPQFVSHRISSERMIVVGRSTPQQYPPQWEVNCDDYSYVAGADVYETPPVLLLPSIGFALRANGGYIYSRDGEWIFHRIPKAVENIISIPLFDDTQLLTTAWNGKYFVAYNPRNYISLGVRESHVARTSDGLNWTTHRAVGDCFSIQEGDQTVYRAPWELSMITSADTRFIAIAGLGARSRLCESDDGVHWTTLSTKLIDITRVKTIENGQIASNSDGSEIVILAVTYGDNDELYFDGVLHITDGVYWEIDPVIAMPYGGDDYFSSVTWADGIFVVAGSNVADSNQDLVPIIYYKRD